MSIELTLSIVSAVVAVLSLIGSILIYNVTRYRENYQNLMDRISLYFSPEMLSAIQHIWGFYREHGDQEFLNKYIVVMLAENKIMESLSPSERLDFQLNSLHYQRRLVTHFWRGVAILIENNLVPRKAVFNWWAKDDIEIVDKILIPLENKVAEYYQVSIYDPETEPLYYLSSIKHKFSR